ncbi:hypothetical protein GCM10028803_10070 [Larkinella knui]|uniref:Anti-sigma factor n=1 Tax=Larkinella knui TaxID=2025310 RepID=A0A3P1CCF2_9BACT|nr:hypothetical protein [Larkinella knui]RRB11019.1 hypothetical protein EHT87_28170 [Larkinella knui]
MMKDKLERFVRDNREDFDVFEPRADLWKDLEKGLGHKERPLWQRPLWQGFTLNTSRRMVWQIAASIALIVGLGGFWYFNHQYGVTEQPDMVAFSPTYARTVQQYSRLIEDKRGELKTVAENNPALYQQFAADFERLEKTYQGLKQELPKTPNQEMMIQAMVQNLKMQIDLLNQQLMIIQRIKQQNNETNKLPV